MTTKHVVVAEDNRVLQDVIRFNLKRAGFEVHTAIEGAAALQLIEQYPIDILITDCQMPGMSGLDLCRRIRADERLHDMPILFCTAKGFEITPTILDELQLPEIICKPFSPRDLIARVQQLLDVSAGRPV